MNDLDQTPAPQQNVDPQLGVYAIYVKKQEDQLVDIVRKLVNAETNNEILQNSLNQANEAYADLMNKFQQLGMGMHATTNERDQVREELTKQAARIAELEAIKKEKDAVTKQRDDLHYELQIQINKNNELEKRMVALEQVSRDAVERAAVAMQSAKQDPFNLDTQPVKKKKVAKVK